MTVKQGKAEVIALNGLLERNEDFLRTSIQSLVQAALEAEMAELLGAEKGERTEGRVGYRSGSYPRSLITRVGTLELRVPQDRARRFSTELFERYQRSEKALVGTLAEMYVQGVSTMTSESGDRGFVRAWFFGQFDQRHQQDARREFAGFSGAPFG